MLARTLVQFDPSISGEKKFYNIHTTGHQFEPEFRIFDYPAASVASA